MSTNNGNFWSNGAFRKRKAGATDLEEQYENRDSFFFCSVFEQISFVLFIISVNQKMFVTEEKMVKEMQTLSLELQAMNNVQAETKPPEPMSNEIIEEKKQEPHIEIHDLFKDTFKNDDLQDSFIAKLCEMER